MQSLKNQLKYKAKSEYRPRSNGNSAIIDLMGKPLIFPWETTKKIPQTARWQFDFTLAPSDFCLKWSTAEVGSPFKLQLVKAKFLVTRLELSPRASSSAHNMLQREGQPIYPFVDASGWPEGILHPEHYASGAPSLNLHFYDQSCTSQPTARIPFLVENTILGKFKRYRQFLNFRYKNYNLEHLQLTIAGKQMSIKLEDWKNAIVMEGFVGLINVLSLRNAAFSLDLNNYM